MNSCIILLAVVTLAQAQHMLDANCGIVAVMTATTRLTQTIKGTNFPDSTTDGFYETVCDLYKTYLDQIDTDSETCHARVLDSLRVVARVGAYYHQISGRCPLISYNKNVDAAHFYEVSNDDMARCSRDLRGDDSCVVNWVQSIKDGKNTCEIYREGIKCHKQWFDDNCLQPLPTAATDSQSTLAKASKDLSDALNHLESLQPEVENCVNMTP